MLPSGLPENVADEEALARFLMSSSHYNATMVKPAAFLPNPKARMTTSVFRHGAEPRESLIQIAGEQRPDVTAYGAAICKAVAVRSAKLDVIADEPPPLHANIVGWPVNGTDQMLEKAEQKRAALVLVSRCTLVLFESKAP
ncbi:MAG TPA: hypothetical protein VLC46_14480 [Thermoanaerobaculia bacterium]|jgi:hypothetical protein|nr:hypothetical protein [Thermoanaerobaculia bacterium]